jgi:hypothetical protein
MKSNDEADQRDQEVPNENLNLSGPLLKIVKKCLKTNKKEREIRLVSQRLDVVLKD